MANWDTLKAAITSAIGTNDNQEITGQLLQNVLNSIVSTIGENATFAGVATPETNPGVPDGPVFYLAGVPGTYANFNGAVVSDEALVLYNSNDSWRTAATNIATIEFASSVANSVTFEKGESGLSGDGVSVYRNVGSRAVWNAANKCAAFSLNLTGVSCFSIVKMSTYNYDTNSVDSLILGLYISAGKIVKAIGYGDSEDITCGYDSSGTVYFNFEASSTHRLVCIDSIASSNRFNNIEEGVIVFRADNVSSYEHSIDIYSTKKDLLEELQSVKTELQMQVDLLNKGLFYDFLPENLWAETHTGYIGTNGTVKSDGNWSYTDYIPLDNHNCVKAFLLGHNLIASVSFYDESYNLIEVHSASSANAIFDEKVQAPEGAAFVRFCGASQSNSALQIQQDARIGDFFDVFTFTEAFAQIADLQKGFFIKATDYWPQATITGFITTSGGITSDANWRSTDFIPCKEGDSIVAHLYWHSAVAAVSFYDESKSMIEYYTGTSSNGVYDRTFVVPAEAHFFRISSASETGNVPIPLGERPLYAKLEEKVALLEQVSALEAQISNLEKGEYERTLDYWPQATITGFITTSGSITSDANWRSTDFIPCKEGDVYNVTIFGMHSAVSNVSFYDSAHGLLSRYGGDVSTKEAFYGEFTAPSNAVFVRFSGGSNSYTAPNVSSVLFNEKLNFFEAVDALKKGAGTKIKYDILPPRAVYTVCNDVIPAKKGRNRNYSTQIFLDHFLNGLTEEKDIHFRGHNRDFVNFKSPLTVTSSNETNPSVSYNSDKNILESTKKITITGADIEDTDFEVLHRSTLNSITASAHPKVLCIGDSITYAEMATLPMDNYTQNYAYHLLCKELFMKDAIDNGGTGYDITFLGIYKKTKTFEYNDTTHSVATCHEGIRGISITQHLSGGVSQFWDSDKSKWSIKAWLNKYRTLDDEGNRLTLGEGTGSLITASNRNSIDVCTPTHVIIALGMNQGGQLSQWQTLVDTIREELPNVYIGIVIFDCAGTYFPSLHPTCDESCVYWNDTGSQGSRHNQQYNLQKMLLEEYGNAESENNKVYTLPLFHVSPTAESVSVRDIPRADFIYTGLGNMRANYGWHASTHTNGIGHINWGYTLYSWLKYTIAKNLQ